MLLLTHSTVSVILSSGVVCTFTLLLFMSGYVLQQQSVRNIQVALNPSSPPVHPRVAKRQLDTFSHELHDKWGLNGDALGGRHVDVNIKTDTAKDLKEHQSLYRDAARNEGNFAYLQLLSDPDPVDICSAISFFKTLWGNGTAIQDRLFMYPEEWDRMARSYYSSHDGGEKDEDEDDDNNNNNKKRKKKQKSQSKKRLSKRQQQHQKLTKPAAKALSLLRSASTKYDIWLLPIDMSLATSAGYKPTDTKLLRLGQIQFMPYDSVLYVRTPGIILDTEKLDSMLLSRPLPMKHDVNRRESYDNEAWMPMPLRAERDESLPPVYLVAVNSNGGHVEARGHVPDYDLEGFGGLVRGSSELDGLKQQQRQQQPGYVYLERDRDSRVSWKGDRSLSRLWSAQQNEVCEGLDLDL